MHAETTIWVIDAIAGSLGRPNCSKQARTDFQYEVDKRRPCAQSGARFYKFIEISGIAAPSRILHSDPSLDLF